MLIAQGAARWSYGEIPRKRLVIIGAGEFAEIAHQYFLYDSPYEVAGFSVHRSYINKPSIEGLPVVPLEEIETHFPPTEYSAYVAVTYTKLNRVRSTLFKLAKEKGYDCARYVSSRAFVWPTAQLGENVFIFEHNVIQHGVRIADDVVLWSGNHVGHRTEIGSHTYLSSHVVVSGYCRVGDYCFLGVNATLGDHVRIGNNCVIGAGALILRDVAADTIVQGLVPEASKVSSLRFYRISDGR